LKKPHPENVNAPKIRYPIGFKLALVITAILLFSLSLITVLVSVMVSSDVRVTAEDNNFTINLRSAEEAENRLTGIRSNALVLLNILSAAGNAPALSQQAAAVFFEQNQHIAAIALTGRAAHSENEYQEAGSYPLPLTLLLNNRFFVSNEADSGFPAAFLAANPEAVDQAARGETILLNGAPAAGFPILVMLCPRLGGETGEGAVIFFDPETLRATFGPGTNVSFMINDQGDVLIHPNRDLEQAGANLGNQNFIAAMWETPEQSRQTLYTGEDNKQYFGAFTKLSPVNAAVITTIESEVVFEGVSATTRRNIYLTLAVLFASIIFIRLFSNSISRPIKALAAAAEQIERGEFEVSLQARSQDEIGALTESFRKMSQALDVFGHFTNREIAVRAMRGEIKPGGLQKYATIFFSDIRDFTEKSEIISKNAQREASDKIVAWLNNYFTRMVDCVEQTGGVVDKFLGDGLLAHWGTAYTSGSAAEDALRCVKAGLLMRRVLLEMNLTAGTVGNPPIRIGCGINTGIVTAGQIGSEQRMEYTVIGDAVNLADRTEALTKPLGTDILITENTWELIKDHVITEEMPLVQIKGKEKPIRLFAVVNTTDAEGEGEPKNLAELRNLLGIPTPDLSSIDTGEVEKKYKIERIRSD
jgi:adenylate cyclase